MEKNNPGLDMKHGFIHHIRRNQYKRDEYDKESKAKLPLSKPKNDSTKHPDRQVYKAKKEPFVESKDNSQTSSPSMLGKLLYVLEYTDNSGWAHKVQIHETDEPAQVAKRLAIAAKVPKELVGTLEWKIEQDIAKRNF